MKELLMSNNRLFQFLTKVDITDFDYNMDFYLLNIFMGIANYYLILSK